MTLQKLALTAAAWCLLSPVWADVAATVVMTGGQTLDLDTGVLGTGNAADLLYTGLGNSLAPLGNGTGLIIVNGFFDQITQANLLAITTYGRVPIPDLALRPGAVIAAKTKTGKYSKILITSNNSGTLVLFFNTFTANANPLAPTITSVQNNYGQIPPGLPNSAVAPGSLFFIKGANLSTVNDGQTLRSSASPGLQVAIGGVSVTVTVNGVSLNCPLYYLSPRQINAVLPGNTPLGSGTMFVTNNQDKSAAYSITVSPSAFGIINYSGSLAATYDANNTLITRFNAANPGQTIVIWGSGVGGDAANDDRLFPQKTNNLNLPMQVLVGGRTATILYRGRSQFPGVDQIVVTLPANAPAGCYVPLVVVTGSIVSNGVTIPVAASGKTCADPGDPLTPALIQELSAKPTIRYGFLALGRTTHRTYGTGSFAYGDFYTANNFGPSAGSFAVSVGHCLVQAGYGNVPLQFDKALGAGVAINVIGPQSSLILTRTDGARYEAASVPENFVPTTGGNFVFDSLSGGADVQRFTTILTLPSNFTWTNLDSLGTIPRQGATVFWSGGTTAAYVEISGQAYSQDTPVYFTCLAPTSPGQFTIPAFSYHGGTAGLGFTLGQGRQQPTVLHGSRPGLWFLEGIRRACPHSHLLIPQVFGGIFRTSVSPFWTPHYLVPARLVKSEH